MRLVPILPTDNGKDLCGNDAECLSIFEMTIEFYKRIDFVPPWICYFVYDENNIVGSAGFKGKPVNNRVEIAYGTMDKHRRKGIGAQTCRLLIERSLATDSSVLITARTLPEENYSTRILKKNGFILLGFVIDPEDGEVWEWEYRATS